MISKIFDRLIYNNWKWIKFFEIPRVISKEIDFINNGLNSERTLRILDIGAGNAEYWNDLRLNRFKNLEITLLDASSEAYSSTPSAEHTFFRDIGIVPAVLDKYEDSEFDLIVALDLIEHLSKADGYLLLYQLDRISTYSSLIFTPNGFSWQPPSTNNPYNAHISGWKPNELRRLGWNRQSGMTGWKFAIGAYGLSRYSGKVILAFLILSLPLTKLLPRLAFSFSAVKRSKNIRIYEQRLK